MNKEEARKQLAEYAGKQFTSIYEKFMMISK